MIPVTALLLLKYFVTYFLSSFILYQAIIKYSDSFSNNLAALASLIIGPMLSSWFFIQLVRFFPFHSDYTYILFLFLIFLLLYLPLRQKEFHIFQNINLSDFKPNTNYDKFSLAVIMIIIIYVPFHYITHAILGNDPLDYLALAELILSKKELTFYPTMDGSHTGGMIFPYTHPLGFPSFFALNMLGIGDVNLATFSVKLACYYYLLLQILLLTYISSEFNLENKYLAGLIYLSTPFILILTLRNHIDPFRIILFTLSTIIAANSISKPKLFNYILLGLITGLSWFIHSSGTLNAFIIIGLTCLYTLLHKNLLSSITLGIIASIVCLVMVIPDMVQIYEVTGRIIGDTENIAVINALKSQYQNYWNTFRGLGHVKTNLKKLSSTFWNIRLFGITYILFFLSVPFNILRWNKLTIITSFSLLAIIVFYIIGIMFTLIGSQVFVFNPRYLLQPIALMSIFTATIFNRKKVSNVTNK